MSHTATPSGDENCTFRKGGVAADSSDDTSLVDNHHPFLALGQSLS